jgi:TetR/AcrR family tetracycline transcriptional repressor
MPQARSLSNGTAAGKTRGRPREPLTRDRIVQAAVRIMDTEGLEAVTMRRIGRELGVEAMSLYNHVADKEDILAGVVEAVMAEFELSDGAGGEWAERGRAAARAWRELLKAHPNVITLMSEQRKPMTTLRALRPMEDAIGTIRASGLSDQEAAKAFRAFGGYIQGFVLAEVANLFGGDDVRVLPEEISDTLPIDQLPNLAATLPYLFRCDFDDAFEYGLDLMIRGVEAKVAGESGRA